VSTTDGWHPVPARTLPVLVGVAAALAAGALAGLAWAVGFHQTLHRLVHPHWVWLGVAVVGELVAYVGYIVSYREIARAEGGAELEVPKAAALVAAGFGVFVHGGGFSLDRQALQRAGLSKSDARRRVLGLSALEYAVLAPATAIAAVVVLVQHGSISKSLTVPWIVCVPVGAALALLAVRHKRSIRGWPLIGRRFANFLDALELVLHLVRPERRHMLAFAGTIAYWAGDIFCLWSTLHGFEAHTPPVAQLVVGYSTGYALSRRALPLGGAGIVEALLPYALGWVKIALAPALVAVFAYRLINLWLPMIPALAGLPTLRRLEGAAGGRRRRRPGRRRRATRAPASR
jgi:uncharacterized membrane protein YbhN (UPF0104 family)